MAHDSGVCLYEDGKILYFFKEERLTRKKRDKIPLTSLNKILELNDKKIDVVVFCPVMSGENSTIKTAKLILEKNGQDVSNIEFYNLEDSHHLQHASLAFYNSGFEKATVVVIDRNGSDYFGSARESETIFEASYKDGFLPLYKSFWIYNNYGQESLDLWSSQSGIEIDSRSLFGIVKVYESATTAIGEHCLENGKTMGLSAYGNKQKKFPKFFVENGNIPNDFYFSHAEHKSGNYQSVYFNFKQLKGNDFSKNNYKNYADLAWQVQVQTQEAVKYLIKKAIGLSGNKKIILTGGYALNIVSNSFLIKEFPDVEFYFDPMADDSGNAIGGAMLVYYQKNKEEKSEPLKNLFFHGTSHSLKNISGDSFKVSDFVDQICQGKSIAVYQGLAEAGPRALGNRSIFFNAMSPEAKSVVNKIKNREWYRPFALSVLASDADKYFYMLKNSGSRHMMLSLDSFEKTKKLFPGVVHVDGSCRVHTVESEDGLLFEILQKIKEATGHGVILNTSLNLAGEPLVESPEDAKKVFKNSELDILWFSEISTAMIK